MNTAFRLPRLREIWAQLALSASLALITGAAASCSALVSADGAQCATTADCVGKGASFAGTVCSDDRVCVAQGGCSSNQECIDANAGAPFLCRKSSRTCVSLTANGCKPFAEPDDIANDNTIWIGLMQPIDPSSENFVASQTSVNAAELARRELRKLGPGLPPAALGKPRRPLAILACNADTGVDPLPVAKYYADDVGVPAVLGFPSSGHVINIATNVSVSAGMLLVTSFNDSPALLTLPAGSPRLVWNANPNSTDYVPVLGAMVSDLVEPQARKAAGMRSDARIRVAVAYNSNSFGTLVFGQLASKLTFNGGKSVADNGASFKAFDYGDTDDPNFSESQYTSAIASITKFDPHVIVLIGSTDVGKQLLEPLEQGWPASSDHKPYFVMPPFAANGTVDQILELVKADPSRRQRLLAPSEVPNEDVVDGFVRRFNAAFPNGHASSSDTLYDAVYITAYGIVAAGDVPITGGAISSGIQRLLPGGIKVNVGPDDMFTAFNELGADHTIDINGTGNALDWDVATGTPSATYRVECASPAGDGIVGAGVVLDPATHSLVGTFACP